MHRRYADDDHYRDSDDEHAHDDRGDAGDDCGRGDRDVGVLSHVHIHADEVAEASSHVRDDHGAGVSSPVHPDADEVADASSYVHDDHDAGVSSPVRPDAGEVVDASSRVHDDHDAGVSSPVHPDADEVVDASSRAHVDSGWVFSGLVLSVQNGDPAGEALDDLPDALADAADAGAAGGNYLGGDDVACSPDGVAATRPMNGHDDRWLHRYDRHLELPPQCRRSILDLKIVLIYATLHSSHQNWCRENAACDCFYRLSSVATTKVTPTQCFTFDYISTKLVPPHYRKPYHAAEFKPI